MPRLAAALVAGLLLAFGIAACGGGNSDVSDVVPKTTPDLVAPRDTSLPSVTVATTDTTSSVTTPTTPGASGTGTGATGAGTGAATGGTGAATTGGGASSGGTSTGGGSGSGSGSGGFSPFCQSNPGAC